MSNQEEYEKLWEKAHKYDTLLVEVEDLRDENKRLKAVNYENMVQNKALVEDVVNAYENAKEKISRDFFFEHILSKLTNIDVFTLVFNKATPKDIENENWWNKKFER